MIKCPKCNAELQDGAAFCSACGAAVNTNSETQSTERATQQNTEQSSAQQTDNGQSTNFANTFKENITFDSEDSTSEFDPKDIEENKVISLFSYIGILFLIPLLAKPNSKYVKFHVNQGIVLLILAIAIGIIKLIVSVIITALFLSLSFSLYLLVAKLVSLVFNLLSIGIGVLAILGIINACTGKAKTLPLIGKFKILK